MAWWLRALMFKLMFHSGLIKLASGDPTWRGLTALTFHYETQPLPTWVGWYAHQLPVWFHQASCVVMFAIELVVPCLIVGPPRLRRFACWCLVGLQGLIVATGNYAFFNLLAVALCLWLIDDDAWPSWIARWLGRDVHDPTPARPRAWPRWVLGPVSGLLGVLTAVTVVGLWGGGRFMPRALTTFYGALAPFQLVNQYGLFAVMTTTRPEIIVEGSRDGHAWRAYEFRYKPGDLRRAPPFVAPHQPRLDWQMWFAVLAPYYENPWFLRFCERLMEGSPDVVRLLASNPFPDAPPRFIRAVVYRYEFTDVATRRAAGTWWTRAEFLGLYCPVLERKAEPP